MAAIGVIAKGNKYIVLIQPNHESFVGKTTVFLAELFRGHENIFEYNYRISDFVESFRSNGCSLKGNHPI